MNMPATQYVEIEGIRLEAALVEVIRSENPADPDFALLAEAQRAAFIECFGGRRPHAEAVKLWDTDPKFVRIRRAYRKAINARSIGQPPANGEPPWRFDPRSPKGGDR